MNPTIVLLILEVVGLLLYGLASNPKASEVGRLMFACAFLAQCLPMGRVLAGLR